MTAANRSAQFAKLHKVLKKHYKPVLPPAERPVLEHLLFACCLEDACYEAAEEAFAALVHTFFDWNEVRVTSISELSEVISALPDARAAANRIKRVLHGVFEATFAFDLEDKRKKTLGPTIKWLEKVDGTTPFSIAYVVQSALGGHCIPIDAGTMAALRVLNLAAEKEGADGVVPGLERAIVKSKGIEFGSLLHQLGADFHANPFSPQVRDVLLQIDPQAKERFPQRRAPREVKPSPAEEPPAAVEPSAEPSASTGRKKKAEDKPDRAADSADGFPAAVAAREGEKTPGKRAADGEPASAKKKNSPQGDGAAHAAGGEKTTSENLAKRKPR
ncbi:MAG: hypothetical protein ABSG68_25040 [Thermoguttaceae bacterium]|jgi:endonuclease-3